VTTATCPTGYTATPYIDLTGSTLHVADQQGFYQLFWGTGVAAHLFDPTKLPFQVKFDELAGPAIISAVLGGADDITPVTSVATWAETLDAGHQLVSVGVNQLVNPQNYWQVIVTPTAYAAGLKTPADLAGKKVALVVGQDSQYVVDRLLSKNGLTSNDYSLVNLPESSDLAALFSGQVDAIVASPITAAEAIANGGKVIANAAGILNGFDPLLMTPKAAADKKKMAMVAEYLYLGSLVDKWILHNQTAFTTTIFNTFFKPQPTLNNAVGQALASVLYTTGINSFGPYTKSIVTQMQRETDQLTSDGVLVNTFDIASSVNYALTPELQALAAQFK
jgi:NMT1/THI5 like